MSQNKTYYNMNTQQYTRQIMYQGIRLKLVYSRDLEGEFKLDAVMTPDDQNITDLVRSKTLEYFEGLL